MRRLSVIIVLAVLTFVAVDQSLSSGLNPVTSADADLNGDGKMERISISAISEGQHNFVLRINENSVKGRLFEGSTDGFVVLDIDTTDGNQEIAVHTPGPSCDDEYLVFGYAGDTVKQMGRLSRWPIFPGNGIVLVDQWMGFWRKRDKYVLNQQTRTLDLVPQELYYLGIEATVEKVFSVCRTREDTTIVADLVPQSKVIVLLCDPSPTHCKDMESLNFEDFYCDWYCIKSKEGIIGWARLGVFWDKLGLGWAD